MLRGENPALELGNGVPDAELCELTRDRLSVSVYHICAGWLTKSNFGLSMRLSICHC
jgi:hypothetical protein